MIDKGERNGSKQGNSEENNRLGKRSFFANAEQRRECIKAGGKTGNSTSTSPHKKMGTIDFWAKFIKLLFSKVRHEVNLAHGSRLGIVMMTYYSVTFTPSIPHSLFWCDVDHGEVFVHLKYAWSISSSFVVDIFIVRKPSLHNMVIIFLVELWTYYSVLFVIWKCRRV